MTDTKKTWECEKCGKLICRAENCKGGCLKYNGGLGVCHGCTTKTGEWRKELEKLAVEMPDGFYKDCKFYHEVVKHFIADLVSRERQQLIEEILEDVRNRFIQQADKCSKEDALVYADAISVIKSKLTE